LLVDRRALGRLGVAEVSVNASAARAINRPTARPRRSRIVDVGYRRGARSRVDRRHPPARIAGCAEAPRGWRLWRHAGDDVYASAVVRRLRQRRCGHARCLPLADAIAATPVVFSAAPFFEGEALAARRVGMAFGALAVALIYAGVIEVVTGADVWFRSVGMFVFFLCVGAISKCARHRAGDLADARPADAGIRRSRQADGSLLRIGALELVAGDCVLVATGAGVPADGALEAECRVDETMLTGNPARQAPRGDRLLVSSRARRPSCRHPRRRRNHRRGRRRAARAAASADAAGAPAGRAAAAFVARSCWRFARRPAGRSSTTIAHSRQRSRCWSWPALARSHSPRRLR
jgi:cation transport ATPase